MPREYRPEAVALNRLLIVQLGLVCISTGLIIAGSMIERWRGADHGFGFFWFAFLAGCFGSSIATLRRDRKDRGALRELGRSWTALLVPHLYGGLMAGLAYMLFLSGILSGTGKNGLLTSNLFPDFASTDESVKPSITAYLALRPASIADTGRLIVWCFRAGYSERFVTGILDQLESRQDGLADRGGAGDTGRTPAAESSERLEIVTVGRERNTAVNS